jgi:transcriptional pleiotropic regulator of transition state genes
MKATGVTRKVDELGRIVIPKELRNTLGIKEKSPLEIFVEGDIILQKYQPGHVCALTGEVSNRNIALAKGKISLSPEGAKLLIKRNRTVPCQINAPFKGLFHGQHNNFTYRIMYKKLLSKPK